MRAPAFAENPTRLELVNWLPLSVLRISATLLPSKAYPSALTQKALSSVLEASRGST